MSRQVREQDVIPFQAQAIVDRAGELPVLSHLTCKLLQYQDMETNKIPIDELCQAISLDAKATAVVLKAANASSNGILARGGERAGRGPRAGRAADDRHGARRRRDGRDGGARQGIANRAAKLALRGGEW